MRPRSCACTATRRGRSTGAASCARSATAPAWSPSTSSAWATPNAPRRAGSPSASTTSVMCSTRSACAVRSWSPPTTGADRSRSAGCCATPPGCRRWCCATPASPCRTGARRPRSSASRRADRSPIWCAGARVSSSTGRWRCPVVVSPASRVAHTGRRTGAPRTGRPSPSSWPTCPSTTVTRRQQRSGPSPTGSVNCRFRCCWHGVPPIRCSTTTSRMIWRPACRMPSSSASPASVISWSRRPTSPGWSTNG